MTKQKKQKFTMIEVVAMLAVIAVLFTAFASAINAVYRTNKTFISESKAVLFMDNVIEQLKNKKNVSREEVKKIFLNEFKLSNLKKDKLYSAKAVEQDGKFVLSIIRTKDNRLLAEVKL